MSGSHHARAAKARKVGKIARHVKKARKVGKIARHVTRAHRARVR